MRKRLSIFMRVFQQNRPIAVIPSSLKGLIVLITKKSIILRVHY